MINIEDLKKDPEYMKWYDPEICIEAVKDNGDALRYVDYRIFEKEVG